MALTKKGHQCRNYAGFNFPFCYLHDKNMDKRELRWYYKRYNRLKYKWNQGLISLNEFHDYKIPSRDLVQRKIYVPWR